MTEETVPALDSIQETNHNDQSMHSEEQQQQPEVNKVQDAKAEAQDDPQERNWREARKALKELRQQNEELRAHLSQLHTKPQQEEEEQSSPDDWVTEKKLQKRLQDLESKIKQREAETVVDRLRSRFTDFDDVVSPENVEYLKENDPELALSLQALKEDPYQQGIAAYKLLKKTDYYLNKDAMKDKKKIEENIAKPPSVNQVRKAGALAEANKFDRGLTPELRKQLLAEMNQARKGS